MTLYISHHLFIDFMSLKSLFHFTRIYPSYFMYVRYLSFTSSLESECIHSTYRELLQGSCLSLILTNIYMIAISQALSSYDFYLFYADDIVVFAVDKFLDNAIHHLNTALHSLNNVLLLSFFVVAPDKSQSIIFTRKRYLNIPPFT